MFVVLQKNIAARALGGEVCGDQISCPGPGHSAKDRSLSVKIDPDAPDGFVCHSFSRDDDVECRDYVRAKLGLAPFKSRKRGPSFSARRRAWRDKLMATEVRNEFKIVGYLLSYHVNQQTCSAFVKASSITRESGIPFATVRKAFEWLEKSEFIKIGHRADSAPYAMLKLGNAAPRYLFSAGSFHLARWFARWHGEWLDEIFLSTELSPGDKLTAYAISVSTDPQTNSCKIGFPTLVKAVGICERTAKSGVKKLEDRRHGNGTLALVDWDSRILEGELAQSAVMRRFAWFSGSVRGDHRRTQCAAMRVLRRIECLTYWRRFMGYCALFYARS